jgi:chorismate dehydratase
MPSSPPTNPASHATPDDATPAGAPVAPAATTVQRIGCVSYINAKPLIEGLVDQPDPVVQFDVPARLLDDLEAGRVDIALCPVIDYFRARLDLAIVPVGAIGSQGPTLTVRLFSRVLIDQITAVGVDIESHTSVALLQILLHQLHGIRPALIDHDAREPIAGADPAALPEALLLIGDKVVTAPPSTDQYPHQLDLGQAWQELTSLPFVFAVWLTRHDVDLGDLPQRMLEQRLHNSLQLQQIATRHAPAHGWTIPAARDYLENVLCYELGKQQWQAINHFAHLAAKMNLIENHRQLELYLGQAIW